MSKRATLFDWFRKLTPPRAAREPTEPQEFDLFVKQMQARLQQDIQIWNESRSERDEWLCIARDSQALSDTLQRIVTAYRQKELHAIAERLDVDHTPETFFAIAHGDSPDVWNKAFQYSVCANPNLPIELFREYLPITKDTVAGLIENPISPLLLLEYPDFVEALDYVRRVMFARYTLQHTNVPFSFLSVLANLPERWLALEAQTHIGYAPVPPASGNEERTNDTPDLLWLDRQILKRVRDEQFHIRCQLYELAWHGLIHGEVATQLGNPWKDADRQAYLREACLIDDIQQCVQEAKKVPCQKRKAQLDWATRWEETIGSYDSASGQMLAFHPEIPFWAVLQMIDRVNPLFVLAALQHPEVPPEFLAKRRKDAFHRALAVYWGNSSPAWPCVFYLTVRDTPEECLEWLSNLGVNMARQLRDFPFLVRLGVALRADDADPYQKQLRTQLLDDPNRYVRAAARREIVWPESKK